MRFPPRLWFCLLVAVVLVRAVKGQSIAKPTAEELAAITERGRVLEEYDQAAWHATDMVETANPKTIDGQHCLAKKENGRWTVVFGALNGDKIKFLISYEAEQLAKPKEFAVKKDDPVKEDTGFYLFAARALEAALADFGRVGRPYNAAVLPATHSEVTDGEGLLYVYLYPTQTKAGIFPFGGDVRYLISADGTRILVKRQLHKIILEPAPAKGKKLPAGYHTHVLTDQPEDTDVLHVLQQDPPVPEIIATAHFLYQVAADGSIGFGKSTRK